MCGAGSATIKNDSVVQNATALVLELIHSFEEVGQLFAQKAVILCKLKHSFLVTLEGKIVVSVIQSELERKSITNAHAIFPVQEKRYASSDVSIEG